MRDVAPMLPELLQIGANHRHASVDARGRLAEACGRGSAGVAELAAACPSVRELLVLSTCHRVELYAVAGDAGRAETELRACLTFADDPEAASCLTVEYGDAAVRHLCRVACGLESIVIGEAEIAGQVRRAAVTARDAGTLGPVLEIVLAGALAASGRARSETRVGRGVLSASTAGVALVERHLAPLGERAVLVIGAGQAGRQALDRLAKRGAGRLFIASRSAHHASQAAGRTGATAIGLDGLVDALARVDAVIAATVSAGYLVGVEMVHERARATARPLYVIDLSVPRVIDPAVADLSGVTLATADDLGEVVKASLARRLGEVPAVERIAGAEAQRASARIASRVARASLARA